MEFSRQKTKKVMLYGYKAYVIFGLILVVLSLICLFVPVLNTFVTLPATVKFNQLF